MYGTSDVLSVTRQDGSTVDNINVRVHDDTAEAILGLWGTSTLTPSHTSTAGENIAEGEASSVNEGWRAGETVLLLQAPGWKIGRSVCNRHLVSS